MKQAHPFIKLAAVASSVLLVAGFVSYRAGAFDWIMADSEISGDTGSGPNLETNASDGSLSEKIYDFDSASTSKSFAPNGFIRKPRPVSKAPAKPSQPPDAAELKPPAVLPSTKLGLIAQPFIPLPGPPAQPASKSQSSQRTPKP